MGVFFSLTLAFLPFRGCKACQLLELFVEILAIAEAAVLSYVVFAPVAVFAQHLLGLFYTQVSEPGGEEFPLGSLQPR